VHSPRILRTEASVGWSACVLCTLIRCWQVLAPGPSESPLRLQGEWRALSAFVGLQANERRAHRPAVCSGPVVLTTRHPRRCQTATWRRFLEGCPAAVAESVSAPRIQPVRAPGLHGLGFTLRQGRGLSSMALKRSSSVSMPLSEKLCTYMDCAYVDMRTGIHGQSRAYASSSPAPQRAS
jgi:hypothetical protein